MQSNCSRISLEASFSAQYTPKNAWWPGSAEYVTDYVTHYDAQNLNTFMMIDSSSRTVRTQLTDVVYH